MTEILYLIVDEFNKAETLQCIFRPLSSLIIWLFVFLILENSKELLGWVRVCTMKQNASQEKPNMSYQQSVLYSLYIGTYFGRNLSRAVTTFPLILLKWHR